MKNKIKKDSLREHMKRSKLSYKEIASITGLSHSTIKNITCVWQTRVFIDKKEIEQLLWAINWYEDDNVIVTRKHKVTASDIAESV